MISATHLCLAILAAGSSRRFGDTDKLTANLHGKMLGLYAADTLSSIAFGRAAIIASAADHPCADGWRAAGLEIIVNPDADSGMASSVAAAAQMAIAANTQGLLICLADMPYIRLPHILRMMERFTLAGEAAILASGASGQGGPPALFGNKHFDHLAGLSGDTGARQLLSKADLIAAPAQEMIDVDDTRALESLNRSEIALN